MSSTFHQRGLWIVIALAALSFLFLLALTVIGKEVLGVRSAEADSYSYSALGHRALRELLERRGVPTMVSRYDSGRRAGEDALLVLAEPRLPADESRRHEWLGQSIEQAGDVLIVLPKREVHRTDPRHRWVESVGWVDEEEVQQLLNRCLAGTRLIRTDDPGEWDTGGFRASPTLPDCQLVGDGLRRLIGCEQGTLLGRHPTNESLHVLTDPDLLANHGIGQGDNAALVLDILDRLRQGRPVVFDEELHGHHAEPSVWRTLFRFPLNLVTMQVFLAASVLALAGLRRFGPPRPVFDRVQVGKERLIRNTAELLGAGRRPAQVAREYFQQSLNDLRGPLHAPATRNTAELCEWLRRHGERRRQPHDVPALHEEVRAALEARRRRPADALDLARRIHAMKQDFLHGP